MRFFAVFCLVAAMAGLGISPVYAATARGEILWQPDYELALAEAQLTGRPLLVHVTAKWCPSCLRLERTTFVDPSVTDLINHSFVAVEVDADASPEFCTRAGVERLPVALVLSPARILLGRIEGYRPAERYVAELGRLLDRLPSSVATSNASGTASARRSTAATSSDSGIQRNGLELSTYVAERKQRSGDIILSVKLEPTLALDGFCPVTLAQTKRSVPGVPELAMSYDGQTYWFAGPEELEKFRAEPARYVPVFGGLCAVSFVKTARQVSGNPRYGALYQGRFYLFAGSEERQAFRAAPALYANCDLAGHGQCPVCRVDQNRLVEGNKEFQEVYGGKVYRFDSAEHRRSFRWSSERYCESVGSE